MAYMRGRGTRENPLDIDAVQTTTANQPPRKTVPHAVDSNDDFIIAPSANAWAQAAQKNSKRRPRASDAASGSRPTSRGQNLTPGGVSRAVPVRAHQTATAVVISDDESSASELQQPATNKVDEAHSHNPGGNVITAADPPRGAIFGEQSNTSEVPQPATANITQVSATVPAPPPGPGPCVNTRLRGDTHGGTSDAAFPPSRSSEIAETASVNHRAFSPARQHSVHDSTPIGDGTDNSERTTSNHVNTTQHSVPAKYGPGFIDHTASAHVSQGQIITQTNGRQRIKKTVTPRDDPSMRVRPRLKRRPERSQQALSQSQPDQEHRTSSSGIDKARKSSQQSSKPPTAIVVTAEASGLLDARPSVSHSAVDVMPTAIFAQHRENGPLPLDSPTPRLTIPTDDIERTRLTVRNCLKRHLQKRLESHAYVTSSLLWRQRTCQETEIRIHHTQPRRRNKSVDDTQHVSPFGGMPAVQIRFDKASNNDKSRLFTQDIINKAKPKNTIAASSWTCPLTTYTCDATIVPPFKEYISLPTNLLADNESKLLATPLIVDEMDDDRNELLRELPSQYEMKHDSKGPLDLRNEQCRFYKQSLEDFLEEVGMTWEPILYWLFAPNQLVKQINMTVEGSNQFEVFLLERSRYSVEEFERDGEWKTTIMFDREGKKCTDLFSKLRTASASELRLSAVIGEAVFDECHFSLWYMAQQSDLFQDYVRMKIQSVQAEPRLTYRQTVCRVCHQHNCLFHGEHREVPMDDSNSDSGSDSGQSSSESQVQQSKPRDQPHVSGLDNDGSSQSDSSDDSDDQVPAHWDSDSDVEKFITYRIPMNSEATNNISEEDAATTKPRKPPEGGFRADWWQNNYSTLKWNQRKPFYPCKHPGLSCDQARCRCYRETITCEKSCQCSRACNRRFPGCGCTHTLGKVCADKNKCLCVKFERECDADLCGTCGATDILDPTNRYNEVVLRDKCSNVAIQRGVPKKTLLGQSTVHGFGLYAGEDIKKDDFIGEYKGEVISTQESNRRSTIYGYQKTMYLFALNKRQDVDATYMGNKLRFINNADKKYTNCAPKNLLCNQVYRIALYASTTIKAGAELFFNYNYPKELTETFNQPNQAPGTVFAVKDTVMIQKKKSKHSTSHTGKPSSVTGQPSAASVKVTSAKVIKGLERARAAKALKAAAKLAESQGAQPSTATKIPDRTGPQRARKLVQVDQSLPGRSTRVSQLRSARSSRGRSSHDSSNASASDTPLEHTDDSDSHALESAESQHYDVVQDTDDDENASMPETQGTTQEPTNSYDALFTSRSSAAVEESDDMDTGRGRSRHSAVGAVVAVRGKKNIGGMRVGDGRPKRKRSFVANSDDEGML